MVYFKLVLISLSCCFTAWISLHYVKRKDDFFKWWSGRRLKELSYLVLLLKETEESGDYSQGNRPYFLNAKYAYCVFPIVMIPSVIVLAEMSVQSMYVHMKIISSSCILTPCSRFVGYGKHSFGTLNPVEPILCML